MNVMDYIEQKVHELYWGADVNCARTTMICLSELYQVPLQKQTLKAAVGMHGAGGYRAQCGLVEGALMFIGIYYDLLGKNEGEVIKACYDYAEAFEKEFGDLRCSVLRPFGFSPSDPPHMCEGLTCRTIAFAYEYIKENTKNRRISFEKIKNARDLGGLKTQDGRVIACGHLLRSANLSEATDGDVKKLEEKYHLSMVVDLRTGVERKERPDVIAGTVAYTPVPIFDESVLGISHEKSAHENQISMRPPVMEDLYRKMVTDDIFRTNLGKAVRTIMEHDFSKGSVLWHCTEGKDRCGLVTMILLGALGVERERIMEDYLLTNVVNAPKAEMYYLHVLAAGKSEVEAEAVKNAFLAKDTYLSAAFSAIDEQYTDMDAYLTEGLGIPENTIAAFREKVLR